MRIMTKEEIEATMTVTISVALDPSLNGVYRIKNVKTFGISTTVGAWRHNGAIFQFDRKFEVCGEMDDTPEELAELVDAEQARIDERRRNPQRSPYGS